MWTTGIAVSGGNAGGNTIDPGKIGGLEGQVNIEDVFPAEFLDIIPDAVVVVDASGHIVQANSQAGKAFGYTTDELEGQPMEMLVPERFRVQHRKHRIEFSSTPVQRSMGTGRLLIGRKKDGAEFPVEVSLNPMDSPGRRLVLAIVRDLTEFQRIQEDLHKSELLFRHIVETANEGIWMLDPQGIVTYANPRIAEMLGLSLPEVVGRSVLDFVDPACASELQASIENREKGNAEQREICYRRKDGSLLYVLCNTRPEFTSDGRFAGSLSMLTDITDRKQFEEELRDSEQKFHTLASGSSVGITTTDENGDCTYISQRWCDLTGTPPEKWIGKGWVDMVHPEDRERLVTEWYQVALTSGEHHAEFRFLNDRGKTIWVHVSSVARRSSTGKLLGWVGVITDISEFKQVESQLLQAQKMEAVGRLAGGVAHDFNNVLTIIAGYSSLIVAAADPNDLVHRQAAEIKKASDRAAALTHQLLAFGRKQILQPRLFDLNAVVKDTVGMLRRMINEDIEVRCLIKSGDIQIKADLSQMEQIVMNLVVNARDSMPMGGKLTIETDVVFLDEAYSREHLPVLPGAYARLAVTDTGTGIAPENLDHIFEPFFTTKEKDKGTGLGLATVYGIVQQSGGTIQVYSEPGHGTTFKIYLPVAEGAAEKIFTTPKTIDFHGCETILLVEDDADVRGLVCSVLRDHGYTVLEAANGNDAMLVSAEHQQIIDVAITDVVMPHMSGRQVAERLLLLRPNLRILYMSGYTDNAIVHHGVLDAETNFIHKPFTPDALARKVRELLDAKPSSAEFIAPTVLVADDDTFVRDMIVDILQSHGFRTIPAGNGREAWNLLRHTGVSLVITDILMPHKDGIDLIFEIQNAFPSVPIIAISSLSGSMDLVDSLPALRSVIALRKPFDAQQLQAALEAALGLKL